MFEYWFFKEPVNFFFQGTSFFSQNILSSTFPIVFPTSFLVKSDFFLLSSCCLIIFLYNDRGRGDFVNFNSSYITETFIIKSINYIINKLSTKDEWRNKWHRFQRKNFFFQINKLDLLQPLLFSSALELCRQSYSFFSCSLLCTCPIRRSLPPFIAKFLTGEEKDGGGGSGVDFDGSGGEFLNGRWRVSSRFDEISKKNAGITLKNEMKNELQ